jgi:very-short-patch-repair endonuclease
MTKKTGFEAFLEKARKVHGDKYRYDENTYVKSSVKMRIICPEHGEFWQEPAAHVRGYNCPKCANLRRGLRDTLEQFIEKARKIHGDKYDYSKVEYVNQMTKVCIICPEHGEFWQRPSNHLHGDGCPECSIVSRAKQRTSSIEHFIENAKRIHGDKYDYSKTEYIDCHTKVCIICPVHGEFWQSPDGHLQGHGCSKCGSTTSNPEDEINNFINETCGIETKTRDRSLLNKRLECDIIVPSYKLAIEFNGLYWHSEAQGKDKNYHFHKTELAESKGYHLIHIFEDEWLEHKNIVLNKIKHFLGCDTDKPVIGARKCTIKTVSKALAEPFLTSYHLQGFVASTAYYGAFYGDILVGVMTFKQEKKGEWNLTRFATDTNYRLPGLASKIFKQFIKDCSPVEVKTFLDRRWSHGDVNVYDRMGFKFTETLAPDYRYVVKNQRLHKFGFRKQILHKKYGLPLSMTEKEMTEKLGFYRIWDCGLYKYVWRKE